MSVSASATPSSLTESQTCDIDLAPLIREGQLYFARDGFTALKEKELEQPWTRNVNQPPFYSVERNSILLFLGAEFTTKTYRSSGTRGFMYLGEKMIYLKMLAGDQVIIMPLAVHNLDYGDQIRERVADAFFLFVSENPVKGKKSLYHP